MTWRSILRPQHVCLALAAVALVTFTAAAGADGPSGAPDVEAATAVSAADALGISTVDDAAVACAERSRSRDGATTTIRATCGNRAIVCCEIGVDVAYTGDEALATAVFSARHLPTAWRRPAGQTEVTCRWTRSRDGRWSLRRCEAPKERS